MCKPHTRGKTGLRSRSLHDVVYKRGTGFPRIPCGPTWTAAVGFVLCCRQNLVIRQLLPSNSDHMTNNLPAIVINQPPARFSPACT